MIVCNFQPEKRVNYSIGASKRGIYEEVFNTDKEIYGGSGITNGAEIMTEDVPMHGCPQSLKLTLPPLSVMYFQCNKVVEKPKKEKSLADKLNKTSKKAPAKKAEEKPKASKKQLSLEEKLAKVDKKQPSLEEKLAKAGKKAPAKKAEEKPVAEKTAKKTVKKAETKAKAQSASDKKTAKKTTKTTTAKKVEKK